MKADAEPSKASIHIQNTAPGPPMLTAVATPARLPVPIRLANATTNAWKEEMCFISPSTFTSIDSSSCPISSGWTLSG